MLRNDVIGERMLETLFDLRKKFAVSIIFAISRFSSFYFDSFIEKKFVQFGKVYTSDFLKYLYLCQWRFEFLVFLGESFAGDLQVFLWLNGEFVEIACGAFLVWKFKLKEKRLKDMEDD